MSTDIQTIQQFSQEQENLIHKTVAKDTTPEEFKLFLEVCKYHRLNPFARQIYAVVRKSQNSGRSLTIQTSIDGYRLLAERSGKYAGQIGPEWCGEDGEWRDVWLKKESPAAARVGILRSDFEKPVWGVAKYTSYNQPSSPMWSKMPDTMLAKCAEANALRRAFPQELSGLYTKEEMDQADSPVVPQVVVEAVESQDTSTIHITNSRDLYELGKVEDMWSKPSGFYKFASVELLMQVSADNVNALSPEQLAQLEAAIREEIGKQQSA